jgi:phage tail sheath protein FI
VPATPTYPGVYIEEVPSTVHTIVGVATSITAFVGYTKRGPVDTAVEVFNFGDFERSFGGLDVDCPLTYAVQQFFLNGGTDALIVRAALNAQAASMQLMNKVGGVVVLALAAKSKGQWANGLQVTVDRETQNPDSLFNLTAIEYVATGAGMVPGNVETFRNLTMNSKAATYAVDTIKANSTLLDATRGAGIPVNMPAAGTSVSAELQSNANVVPAGAAVLMSVAGQPAVSVAIPAGTYTRAQLATALNTVTAPAGVGVTLVGKTLVFTDSVATPLEDSSVHISAAPGSTLATQLGLGVTNGGTEVDAVAAFMPAATGTTGADIDVSLGVGGLAGLTPAATAKVRVTITLPVVGGTTFDVTLLSSTDSLATKDDLRGRLESAIRAAALANPAIAAEIAGTSVAIVDNRLVATAGGLPSTTIAIADIGPDKTASAIGFGTNSGSANLAAYNPAIGTLLTQAGTTLGNDGSPPGATELIGDLLAKSGMNALVDVDLFNLLVLPDAVGSTNPVLSAGMSFCEEHRAMLVVDLPEDTTTLTKAHDWVVDPATPKSANAAAYFPRPLVPDPLQGYRPRKMPGAGAIAGLYARTDTARGVWKAPAGTEASLRGPTGVAVPLTDEENGKLNPFGLNAVRSLPVYGNVVWGARTLYGADVMANQWKYVPVRRVALYIEETLFRGTKWVVFEPNDGPLWAQIRLSVGTFMHGLFRQGAFQGAAPRQAYLVKCDSETTTQADIDQGIVNIIVGFAPLKPAEFVVIKITQLAGQLET